MTMGEGQGAIDWKCSPPHLYAETLIPSVTVIGPLQRWLRHRSEALMNAISAVIEESSICHEKLRQELNSPWTMKQALIRH